MPLWLIANAPTVSFGETLDGIVKHRADFFPRVAGVIPVCGLGEEFIHAKLAAGFSALKFSGFEERSAMQPRTEAVVSDEAAGLARQNCKDILRNGVGRDLAAAGLVADAGELQLLRSPAPHARDDPVNQRGR